MSFKVIPRQAREAILGTQLDGAVASMVADIHQRANQIAPVETGALVNSGRIIRKGSANYQVKYGSSRVPYARRRHFENKRNPQSLRYLEQAGDSVTRGSLNKYFKGLTI